MTGEERSADGGNRPRRFMEVPLVIGTAQLGMVYGIANETGKPDESVAMDIVGTALDEGVWGFDTAQAYGESEALLGRAFRMRKCPEDLKIISKFSPQLSPEDILGVLGSIRGSLERLGLNSLSCMMFHRFQWLSQWDGDLGKALRKESDQGRIQHIGVSVYSASEALAALAHPGVDAVEVPCNAWDRDMITYGVFETAASLKKMVFVRSIFLQGLLLMSPEKVREKLPLAYDASIRWRELARTLNASPAELAVRFALRLSCPVIVGVETVRQLTENLRLFRMQPMASDEAREIESGMKPFLNEGILNPVNWSGR